MWDTEQQQHQRHQSGKTYSLVEMKFRRDKNQMRSLGPFRDDLPMTMGSLLLKTNWGMIRSLQGKTATFLNSSFRLI